MLSHQKLKGASRENDKSGRTKKQDASEGGGQLMGIKVNKYEHCCWEAKGSSSKLSGTEDDVYWLNKITFMISVSAHWIYSALKKAAK